MTRDDGLTKLDILYKTINGNKEIQVFVHVLVKYLFKKLIVNRHFLKVTPNT